MSNIKAVLTGQEIEEQLRGLNQAKIDYAEAATREAKKQADLAFQACWHWLAIHDIPLSQDEESGFWKIERRKVSAGERVSL